jgi:hypothetical protein
MADRIEVHAESDFIGNGHAVYIIQGDSFYTLTPISFVAGDLVTAAIKGRDGTELLQAAMNCAWAAGIRPIGFSDTTEQVRALERHLEDMRAIAFAKTDVAKPNG